MMFCWILFKHRSLTSITTSPGEGIIKLLLVCTWHSNWIITRKWCFALHLFFLGTIAFLLYFVSSFLFQFRACHSLYIIFSSILEREIPKFLKWIRTYLWQFNINWWNGWKCNFSTFVRLTKEDVLGEQCQRGTQQHRKNDDYDKKQHCCLWLGLALKYLASW